MNILRALSETFWILPNFVTRHNSHDYIDKICNQFQNFQEPIRKKYLLQAIFIIFRTNRQSQS